MKIDLGSKPPKPCDVESGSSPAVRYPGLNISTAKPLDVKADETFEAKVTLRFKGFRKSDFGSKDKPFSSDFDVMSIEFGDHMKTSKKKESRSDQEEIQSSIEDAMETAAE